MSYVAYSTDLWDTFNAGGKKIINEWCQHSEPEVRCKGRKTVKTVDATLASSISIKI